MLRTARLHILGSGPLSPAACAEGKTFGGWEARLLSQCLERAGVPSDQVEYSVVSPNTIDHLNSNKNLHAILCLGERALRVVTGSGSLEKYHLSPLDTLEGIECPKAVGSFDPKRIAAQYSLRVLLIKAMIRAWEGCAHLGPWFRKETKFQVAPDFKESLDTMDMLSSKEHLAVDIETGAGIINTVGFAWSDSEAIAIDTRPESYDDLDYWLLWHKIAHVMENSSIKKIFQNNIYEALYYSKYGIKTTNIFHDTMWAQRVLWTEFKINLGMVGRFYTEEIYWKDDGKIDSGSEKKDWHNIKNWDSHWIYNCKDTSGTYEAFLKQNEDLKARSLDKFFYGYLMKLAPPIIEMCSRGLPVNEQTRQKLEDETSAEIERLIKELSAKFNHRSSKQKLEHFKAKGYKIPKKRNSKGQYKESTDELSMKKLRLKYPDDQDIQTLLGLAKLEKALSSYIKFDYDRKDSHVRFMMNGVGTETLRFNSSMDPWDQGFNAQTIPSKYKILFDAPEGYTWVNIDLKQAESRYVAYACGDQGLIDMLEDPAKDVHKFVASNIFGKPEDEIDHSERQLGKKSGHGANYSMAATTFMESCLKEMDLVITTKEANHILETYHRLFPGIRQGHKKTRALIRERGWLENPAGYRRYFYGRLDDNTFRESYAFEPQSTIPYITNSLMLYMLGQRDLENLDFRLHLQVHDSLVFAVPKGKHLHFMDTAYGDIGQWHPEIHLTAGKLVIPIECEWGDNLKNLTTYEGDS